uniref:Putative secreted peptide n=1 Tax=Anopheles braziliensis TaxID=58242 RepID=A0A2M3ZMF2_9DIPT
MWECLLGLTKGINWLSVLLWLCSWLPAASYNLYADRCNDRVYWSLHGLRYYQALWSVSRKRLQTCQHHRGRALFGEDRSPKL